jgi:VanZ family protein
VSTLDRALVRFGRWPYVLAWAALIAGLSSIPNNFPPTDPSELNADKLVHFGLYFVLAALAVAAAMRRGARAPIAAVAVIVVAAAALFGAADEIYQGRIPGRDPNPVDWAADVLGTIFGAATATLVVGRERRGGR